MHAAARSGSAPCRAREGAGASLAHTSPDSGNPPTAESLNSPRSSAGTEEATSTGVAVCVGVRVGV